jgi:hypothetical protein
MEMECLDRIGLRREDVYKGIGTLSDLIHTPPETNLELCNRLLNLEEPVRRGLLFISNVVTRNDLLTHSLLLDLEHVSIYKGTGKEELTMDIELITEASIVIKAVQTEEVFSAIYETYCKVSPKAQAISLGYILDKLFMPYLYGYMDNALANLIDFSNAPKV